MVLILTIWLLAKIEINYYNSLILTKYCQKNQNIVCIQAFKYNIIKLNNLNSISDTIHFIKKNIIGHNYFRYRIIFTIEKLFYLIHKSLGEEMGG